MRQLINKLADKNDKIDVEAIFKEVQAIGKAIETLPESERLVRQFHAAEVLKVPLSKLRGFLRFALLSPARNSGASFAPLSPAPATRS